MRAEGHFDVTSFAPTELQPAPGAPVTGLPVGVAVMEKYYDVWFEYELGS